MNKIFLIFLLFFGKLLCAQQPVCPQIAISLDDLPTLSHGIINADQQQQYFLDILSALDQYNIQANGFFVGKLLQPYQRDLLKEFVKRGHQIGNHTYAHYDLNHISAKDFCADIIKNQNLMEEMGFFGRNFRYPMLHRAFDPFKKDSVIAFLKENAYTSIPVSIDTDEADFNIRFVKAYFKGDSIKARKIGADYVQHIISKSHYYNQMAQEMFHRPFRHILLLHMNFINAKYLGQILKWYQDNNWKFISVGEAVNDPVYQMKDDCLSKKGLSWLERINSVDFKIENTAVYRADIPDLMQMNPGNPFPDEGRYYCGPAVMADYMLYYSFNGFPDLIKNKSVDTTAMAIQLAEVLGSSIYMNATAKGVSAREFLDAGISYVQKCGYDCQKAEYWSFEHYAKEEAPSLEDFKKCLGANQMAWLIIGKYTYDEASDVYYAKGLHYVALTSFGLSPDLQYCPDCLAVLCPSPRSGVRKEVEFSHVELLEPAEMYIPQLDLQVSTKGFYKMKDGLRWARKGEHIIINGFMYLKIK